MLKPVLEKISVFTVKMLGIYWSYSKVKTLKDYRESNKISGRDKWLYAHMYEIISAWNDGIFQMLII